MRLICLPVSRIVSLSVATILLLIALSGCGGNSACKINSINVSPLSATANHSAAPPGNMQHFDAFIASEPSGCAVAQTNLTNAKWSVSDTVNVSISNVNNDASLGTATCQGATAGAITVTATVPAGDGTNVSNTASLTCN